MNLYKAVVEDNNDPKRLGRVRIRVLGVHSAKLKDVATEQLPWTECIQPLNQGNTLGSSTYMKMGSWCYCTPLNDSYSEFLVLGSMKGVYNDVPITDEDGDNIGFRDPDLRFPVRTSTSDNLLTYGKPDDKNPVRNRVQVGEFKEDVDTSPNAIYPNNEVFEDHNGNIVEIDGSIGNSRIRVQHSSGARVEISVDGDITIQASKGGNIWQETPGLFAIGADGNMIIDCDLKVTGSIESGADISAGANITAGAEVGDASNTLSDLALEYANHGHPISSGSSSTPSTPPPAVSYTPLKTGPFVWSGTPK